MKPALPNNTAPGLLAAGCYCRPLKLAGCCVICAAWRALFRKLDETHRMVCAWRNAGSGRHA